jgi:2-dehydro-3-deoxygalactonokinase
MAVRPEWIGVELSQTDMRVWAMDGGDAIATKTAGVVGGVGAALEQLTRDWRDGPVTAIGCGEGIAADLDAVPCAALPDLLPARDRSGMNVTFHALPGLRQDTPPDRLWGDVARIAGFVALHPGWDGVLCLVGAQTRWVHISAGEVVSFQTFLTGEISVALGTLPSLRDAIGTKGSDARAFARGLADGMDRPDRLIARFGTFVAESDPVAARSRLCGLLVGAEISVAKPYWLGQQAAVIGDDPMAGLYLDALLAQGVPAIGIGHDTATLAGLTSAWRRLERTRT